LSISASPTFSLSVPISIPVSPLWFES
jgi:hypothetical protein